MGRRDRGPRPGSESLPADTEERLAEFTELVATAIANAESRAAADRLAGADRRRRRPARRRIERDLHDGAQQRLVTLALRLRAAQADGTARTPRARRRARPLVAEATGALDELREIARRHPPGDPGQGRPRPGAARTLARRCAVPVELDVRVDGPPPGAGRDRAYYVVAEALTNAAKHAHASAVTVTVETTPATSACASKSATTARRRRLHPRHRPARPQGPRRGARRPILLDSPPRAGNHAAGHTPDHRGTAIFLQPDARPAGRPSRGPRHGRPRLFASAVMRPAASASNRRRAHGRRRPIAHHQRASCSRNGHARSSVVRLRLSVRRFSHRSATPDSRASGSRRRSRSCDR